MYYGDCLVDNLSISWCQPPLSNVQVQVIQPLPASLVASNMLFILTLYLLYGHFCKK